MSVEELKTRGNKAFSAKSYDEAINLFSQALSIDPSNHVLYSNRSASHAGKRQWNAALEDAEKVRPCPTRTPRPLILLSFNYADSRTPNPNSASTQARPGQKATHARAPPSMASENGTTPSLHTRQAS